MKKYFILIIAFRVLIASTASAVELDLEGATSRGNPYCIDMRILSERNKASAVTSTKALNTLFNCKKTYVLPLSVRADTAMVQRYVKKLTPFKGHKVLMWCTEGVRSGQIAIELAKVGIKVDTVIGGTFYLSDALGMN